jgi:hypothetical protein
MVDVSQEILDNIFNELAALRSEVARMKAMGRRRPRRRLP